MALITTAEFKTFQDVTSTDNDPIIASLVSRIHALVIKFLGREIESTDVVGEVHDEFEDTLILKKFPVINLTSVSVNGTALTETTDYVLKAETGEVVNMGAWKYARRAITVDYTYGYASIPDDIKLACLELAKLYYTHMNSAEDSDDTIINTFNASSKSMGESDVDFDTLNTLKRIKGLLLPYRAPRVG